MSLRIKDFSPAHLPVLNRWAEQNDSKLRTHDEQLAQVHTFLEALFEKNPSLTRPNK